MKFVRSLAVTTAATGLFLGSGLSANAATDTGTARSAKAPVSCTIQAGAPYLANGRIQGDGRINCTSAAYALQMKVTLQKRVGARWINVGVPAQGTRYNVVSVWGTAYTGFAHGIYRTKSTGKVQFWGDPTWYPISKVSAPRSA